MNPGRRSGVRCCMSNSTINQRWHCCGALWLLGLLLFVLLGDDVAAESPSTPPLFRTIDLNRDETQQVELSNGAKVRVKLLEVEEIRDSLRTAVRDARVKVAVNGRAVTLHSGNYHLPVTFAGVQIDCPVTQGYYPRHD